MLFEILLLSTSSTSSTNLLIDITHRFSSPKNTLEPNKLQAIQAARSAKRRILITYAVIVQTYCRYKTLKLQ